MSAHAEGHSDHGVMTYVKIYLWLLLMLIVSIAGPEIAKFLPAMIGKPFMLFTAFGIAIVKALMVAAYFMHLNIERKYIWYMLYTMLILVFMFFAGTAPDVMETEGRNWKNSAALQLIEDHHNKEAPEEEPH